jgi:hypothetical protein
VLITAFCRPELTVNSTVSILERFPGYPVIVSQDGKIPGFFEEGHSETRAELIKIANIFPSLELNLRDKNKGLTAHLLQILGKLFKYNKGVIFLEEDMFIDGLGLNYLSEIGSDDGLSHRTAFSSTKHPTSLNPLDFRLSFFPEQWGVAINSEMFEAFKAEAYNKTVERKVVRDIVLHSGYGRLKAELLADFWTQLFRQEVSAPHGWDATLQLALWRNKVPSKVSLRNFISDLGGGLGAITRRNSKSGRDPETLGHNAIAYSLCIPCEKMDASRRQFSGLSQIRSRLRIRNRIQVYLDSRKFK